MGGGKEAMDITLSFYTQYIRVLGIRTPPPTSLGLATPLRITNQCVDILAVGKSCLENYCKQCERSKSRRQY